MNLGKFQIVLQFFTIFQFNTIFSILQFIYNKSYQKSERRLQPMIQMQIISSSMEKIAYYC